MIPINFLSDIVTAASYFVITFQLALLAKHSKMLHVFQHDRSTDVDKQWSLQDNEAASNLGRMVFGVVLLFASFIFMCGTTHLILAVEYLCGYTVVISYLKSFLLFLCALVSFTTALLISKLFPLLWNLTNKLRLSDEGKLELFQNFMETMALFKESMTVLSLDYRIVQGNSSTSRVFGKNFEGACLPDNIHEEDVAKFKSAFDVVLHSDAQPTVVVEYRVKQSEPDHYLWVESRLGKKICKDKQCEMFVNMITKNIDETKIGQMNEEIRNRSKNESAQNAAKLSYISCVAHDLKTPLHSFCFVLDLLKDANLTKDQEELIETAEVSTDLMRLTISQTMDINKVLSGKDLIPRRTTVSLSDVMRRVNIIINCCDKTVPVLFNIEENVYDSIITDEEWLWQMLLNLLTNACKYTEMGKIEVRVKILSEKCDSKREMLLFEVHDTGVGISASKFNSLFSAFGQAQEGASTGTGLGLFGLKARATGLGGSCGAYPNAETGPGSVFWFSIPYIKDETMGGEEASFKFNEYPILKIGSSDKISTDSNTSSESISPLAITLPKSTNPTAVEPATDIVESSPRLLESKIRQGPITAIIIDDMLSLRKLMTKILTKIGFERIYTFENGSRGLEAMKTMEVDAVFSDIQMPLMTGPEMIKRFREFEQGEILAGRRKQRQLVAAITANGGESKNLQNDNAFDFIYPKPLDVRNLNEVVRACARRRKQNINLSDSGY